MSLIISESGALNVLEKLQQQQQQHTLLTFPKGAFQRQCYKNNPITIKKILFTIKDVLKSECSKRKIKAYKYIKLQLFE